MTSRSPDQGVAPEFDLSITDRLLTTTRSVRLRLDLDRRVTRAVIDESLRVALQAATGGNNQRWRWVVVTDQEKRRAIGEVYKRSFGEILARGTAGSEAESNADLESKWSADLLAKKRMMPSVQFLIDHMGEVPVLIVPSVIGRNDGDEAERPGFPPTVTWVSSQFGSVYPAIWNLQLALRTRVLGSCITCAHLEHEREVAELLGIPYDQVMQVCLLPVAYHTGETFRPAARRDQSEVVFYDTFDHASLEHDW